MSSKKKHAHKGYDLEHLMVLILVIIFLVAILLPREGLNIAGEARKKPVVPDGGQVYVSFPGYAGDAFVYLGYTYRIAACVGNSAKEWKPGEGYMVQLLNSPDIYGVSSIDVFAQDSSPLKPYSSRCFYFPIKTSAAPGRYTFQWAIAKSGLVLGQSGMISVDVIERENFIYNLDTRTPPPLPPAPGSYIGENYDPMKAPKPFAKDAKVLMVVFRYDYGVDGSVGSMLSHQPVVAPSFASMPWFEKEVRDLVAAGVDVVLPVYGGYPGDASREWANVGLKTLVQALLNLKSKGVKIPLIGLYLDPKVSDFKGIDFGVNAEKKTWGIVRDFYSLVPPELRAAYSGTGGGSPVASNANMVVVGPTDGSKSIPGLPLRTFALEFGGEAFHFILDTSWGVYAEQYTKYGAALNGPDLSLKENIQVGPGFDNSNSIEENAAPTIRDRENGMFYAKSWNSILSDPNPRYKIILDSWNNYYEGSELDETAEHSRLYIALTSAFASKWKGAKDDASISIKAPATMNLGSSYSVTATVLNKGTTAWSSDLGYKLAVLEPSWGVSRVELAPGESIAPGGSKTFTFNVGAPSTVGKYPLTLKMVQEISGYLIASFGNSASSKKPVDASITVTVKALPPKKCKKDADCPGQKCVDKVCQSIAPVAAPSCSDGIKNGQESDVDCGQSCSQCAEGKTCTKIEDCKSNSCVGGKCQTASCVPNCQSKLCGDEDGCGSFCTVQTCPGDQVCVNGNCGGYSASCGDGNCQSSESCSSCSQDCGACPLQIVCGNSQCESGETPQSCAADCKSSSPCFNGVKNSKETDVDCGGSSCQSCVNTKRCVINRDCKSGYCVNNICKSACAVLKGGKCPDERGGVKQCGSSAHRVDGTDCYWCCVPS